MSRRFIAEVFKARLKAAVTLPFIAAFFLLMLSILALGFVFNEESGLRFRVGVLQPDTERAEYLTTQFISYAGENADVVIYSDEERLKLDVSAHKLECAYVFGFDRAVAYRSEWTVADKVFDLCAAASYTGKLAGELGAEVLGEETLTDEIQARADEYLNDGPLMGIEYATRETSSPIQQTGQAAPYRSLFHRLLGLAALLPAMFYAMSASYGVAAEARLKAERIFKIAGFLTALVLSFTFIVLTLIIGNLLFPGVVLSWPQSLLTAFALAWAGAGISALLAAFVPPDAFPAVIALAVILAAIFGGAVFNMREVYAQAGFISYLFPNYYYVTENWLVLFCIGTVCGGAACIKIPLLRGRSRR
jgi:hypothetical protein